MAYSFTYGGTRAETLGLEVQNVVRDILPPVTPRTVPVPQRAGNVFFRTDFEMREIQVQVFIVGSGADTDAQMQDAQSTVRTIANFLDPTDGVKELIFDDETDKKYNAIVSGDTNLNQILELKRGTITFLVPDAFALSTTQETLPFNVINFSRASRAFKAEGTTLDVDLIKDVVLDNSSTEISINSNVPRYFNDNNDSLSATKFNQNMLVEESTTNLVSQNASIGNSAAFTTVSSSIVSAAGQGITQITEDPNNQGLVITTDNATAEEGVYHEITGISASTTYTFSAHVSESTGGGTVILRIQELDNSNVVQATTDSSVITLNSNYARYSVTATTTASTTKIRAHLITDVQQNMDYRTDGWQLEQKGYMTTWHLGGASRSGEVAPVPFANMMNGTTGTLELLFTPKATPTAFGAVFDWGQFDAGSAKDRLGIFHGTSIGTSRKTFQFNMVNGSTTTSRTLSVALTNETAVDQFYYVAVRWNIVGAGSTMKIDVHDFTNDETVSNTLSTTLDAPSFSSFPNAHFGSNQGGGNWTNLSFDEAKFSENEKSDSEISANITALKADTNTFTVDEDGDVSYHFDKSLLPTLYLKGNVKQVGVLTIHQSSDLDTFKLVERSSGEFIQFLDDATVVSNVAIDFERRVLEDVDFSPSTAIMSELSIDSIFFDLEHDTEIEFYFNGLTEHAGIDEAGTFVYTPRFL